MRNGLFLLSSLAIGGLAACTETADETPVVNTPDPVVSVEPTDADNTDETTDFAATSAQTLADLRRLEDMLVRAGLPVVDRGFDINRTLPELLEANGMTGVAPAAGGSFIYVSDGQTYELLAVNTPDCPAVLETQPELVNRRSKYFRQGTNCISYGIINES